MPPSSARAAQMNDGYLLYVTIHWENTGLGWIDIPGPWFDIDKDRDPTFVHDGIRRGDERKRRSDHPIILFHPGGDDTQMQACCARVDANAELGADVVRRCAFKCFLLRTNAQDRRLQDRVNGGNVARRDVRRGHRDGKWNCHVVS